MDNQENLIRLWHGRVADGKLRLEFARSFVTEARQAYANSPALEDAIRAENVAQNGLSPCAAVVQ
jgi:hypothetical protein